MRGWRLTVVTVFALAVVAGCIGTDEEPLEADNTDLALDPAAIDAPEGAEIHPIEEGLRLVLEDVELPLQEEITLQEDVAMVEVRAQAADGNPITPFLVHEGSGALRCNPSLAQAWNVGVNGTTSCAGLTALDPAGATWGVYVSGTATIEQLVSTPVGSITTSEQPAIAETIQIDLRTQAPGGLVEELDLDALSMPHHEIGETTYHDVESHDGSELFVEVTTPADDAHEAHPTLLVSSPYTASDRQAGNQPYADVVQDYVPRGYAVVVADVRGFGQSGGCMEVWGPNEQADQAVLVDWITDQDFSDGNVGMYGVSYPGTTPVQAAVQAPEGLEAIISVAGVLDAYKDWHFGGVPNGESIGSPVAYHQTGSQTSSSDPLELAQDTANAVCDPTLVSRANDPRAVYDEFYEVRNLTARADEVEAAVMVEHGYNDVNVKSAMQVEWFNDLDVPKMGLFGHWHHQLGARADEATMRLAWMDQFVKGEDVGLANVSKASITANGDRYREADAWPAPDAEVQALHPDFDASALGEDPTDGQAQILLEGSNALPVGEVLPQDTMIELSTTLEEPLRLAGPGSVALDVSLEGASNAYVAAHLFHDDGDTAREVTFGWVNLAHRDDHTSYDPLTPGERVQVTLPLLPTETTFEEGDELRLMLRGVTEDDWSRMRPGTPGQLTVHGGEDATALQLPTLGEGAYEPVPASVTLGR